MNPYARIITYIGLSNGRPTRHQLSSLAEPGFGAPLRVTGQNGSGQNGMDKMEYGQNVIRQNGMDKMIVYGQNGSKFWNRL